MGGATRVSVLLVSFDCHVAGRNDNRMLMEMHRQLLCCLISTVRTDVGATRLSRYAK